MTKARGEHIRPMRVTNLPLTAETAAMPGVVGARSMTIPATGTGPLAPDEHWAQHVIIQNRAMNDMTIGDHDLQVIELSPGEMVQLDGLVDLNTVYVTGTDGDSAAVLYTAGYPARDMHQVGISADLGHDVWAIAADDQFLFVGIGEHAAHGYLVKLRRSDLSELDRTADHGQPVHGVYLDGDRCYYVVNLFPDRPLYVVDKETLGAIHSVDTETDQTRHSIAIGRSGDGADLIYHRVSVSGQDRIVARRKSDLGVFAQSPDLGGYGEMTFALDWEGGHSSVHAAVNETVPTLYTLRSDNLQITAELHDVEAQRPPLSRTQWDLYLAESNTATNTLLRRRNMAGWPAWQVAAELQMPGRILDLVASRDNVWVAGEFASIRQYDQHLTETARSSAQIDHTGYNHGQRGLALSPDEQLLYAIHGQHVVALAINRS